MTTMTVAHLHHAIPYNYVPLWVIGTIGAVLAVGGYMTLVSRFDYDGSTSTLVIVAGLVMFMVALVCGLQARPIHPAPPRAPYACSTHTGVCHHVYVCNTSTGKCVPVGDHNKPTRTP